LNLTQKKMDRGYIRITKAGPSGAAQRAAILAAGVDVDHLYIDDVRTLTMGGAADLVERTKLLRDVAAGSRVVVFDLERIGVSTSDILTVVGAVMVKGAVVLDLASGKTYEGIEAGQLHLDAAAAERRQKQGRMDKARKALAERKIKPGPEPKLTGVKRIEAEADYRDVTQSVRAVARKHEVSTATLRRAFGDRDMPPGRRKKPTST